VIAHDDHPPDAGIWRCRSCDEEYGLGAIVPASDRPGICASCATAMDELAAEGGENGHPGA
jgi:ribosomal protein L37AE/L43A